MATAFQTLRFRLSDGSLTVDLLSTGASGYALQESGYAPRVATLSESPVATVPFEEVTDEIRFNIFAPAGSAATLRALIRDAGRVFRQARINDKTGFGPVCLFDVQLSGGVLMTARVREAALELPSDYNDTLTVEEVAGARLTFTRTGWLLNATPETATSAAITTSAVGELLFASAHPTDSPVRVSLTSFSKATVHPTSLFLWSDQASTNGIRLNEAEASAGSTGFTSIVDPVAGTVASGNILRYTPTTTTEALSSAIAQTTQTGIVSVFTVLRSSSSAVQWKLRLIQYWNQQNTSRYGPTRVLDGATALNPTVFWLGDVTLIGGEALLLGITASTTSGSPLLDFDVFVLLNRSYGRSGAIQITGGWESNLGFSHVFDDRSLTDRSPLAYSTNGTVTFPLDAQGPLPILSGLCTPSSPVAGRIRAVLLQPIGSKWRYSATTTAETFTMSGSKYLAYTMPE